MVKIFDADLVKDHFIITDNGKRALIDTGCPFIINDGNKQSKPMGELYLNDARRNVDTTIDEFRGLEYFAQRMSIAHQPLKGHVVDAAEGTALDDDVLDDLAPFLIRRAGGDYKLHRKNFVFL